MLVVKLYELFSSNKKFAKEETILDHCGKTEREGIWDILGYYDPQMRTVTLCENEIIKHSKALAHSLHMREHRTYLILRELVRLHEHSHAILHMADFKKELGASNALHLKSFPRKLKRNFPVELDEAITEFISWSIISEVDNPEYRKVFLETDRGTPPYYQDWKKLRQLIDSFGSPKKRYVDYVPGIVYFARRKSWENKSFDEFIREISRWLI